MGSSQISLTETEASVLLELVESELSGKHGSNYFKKTLASIQDKLRSRLK